MDRAIKWILACGVLGLWLGLYVQILSQTFPSDPLACEFLTRPMEDERLLDALPSQYYPPLFSLVTVIAYKLGLKDPFMWQLVGGIATLALAILAFYRYKPLALLVGLVALLFNFGVLRAPLSFWRETMIVWILLLMLFCLQSLRRGVGLTFFSALFGAFFGLGMLTKWTFWLYAAGFVVVAFFSVPRTKRSRFMLVFCAALIVVALPWYLFGADYELIFASTSNNPVRWAPSYVARLGANLSYLFESGGGFSVCAFFILLPPMLVRRLTASWVAVSIVLTIAVLALPLHVEFRYLVPLVVPIGFAMAELIQKISKGEKGRILALIIAVVFVPITIESAFFSHAPKIFLEEDVGSKKFFPQAISALAENAGGGKTVVAFNPWFECDYFCYAVSYLQGGEHNVVFELLNKQWQLAIVEFNRRLEDSHYNIIINLIPVGLDLNNPAKVFGSGGIRRSEYLFTEGIFIEMPGWDEFRKMLNNLSKRYKLLSVDEIEGKKVEIWVKKK